jgi:hypothetical protein
MRRTVVWIVVAGIAIAILILQVVDTDKPAGLSSPVTATAATSQRLVGRWLRPDGQYVLDVRQIHSDGRVEAAYLNPRPIHVSEAKVEKKNGRFRLRLVLRDQGYPGSYYDLTYDVDTDRLIGEYYQAAMGAVFDVQFVRIE